jgi:hypothetical protein
MFIPNISITAMQLAIINSQFYRFLMFCGSKVFFVSQMVSLIVLQENILKIPLKED